MATPALVGTNATTAASTSTSFTCNKPAGVVENDLLLSLQFSDTGIGTITSGWTQLQTNTTGMESRVGMKIAGPSEAANYTFTQSSGSDGGAIIVAITDILAGSTPVSAFVSGGSGSNVSTPSVVPEGIDDFEVRFAAGINVTAFTAPSGMTLRGSVASGGAIAGGCATRVLTSNAGTGTADFPTTGTPLARHGYTITVTGVPAAGRRIVVATYAAVRRAASW